MLHSSENPALGETTSSIPVSSRTSQNFRNALPDAAHVGALTDLGARLYESGKKILAGYWRGVGAINHPISAPKMKRSSIFLNAASGFLKKYSPEVEKS